MITQTNEIQEGLINMDLWNRLDFHVTSYIKSPIQLRYLSSKTLLIGQVLRHGVVDLLDKIIKPFDDYIENETTILGTEHRLYHSRQYILNSSDSKLQPNDDMISIEISSFAPTVFYQLREDLGISNEEFRHSFHKHHLKDFTNPGKSGSLMYKTYDDLFILKTLRQYEAHLLIQILSGYHLQFTKRSTLLNRYVGLYSVRIQTSISPIEIFVVVMVNAFTPSLKINEIFDLKGSKIKRKLAGDLSVEKLHKLKDMDFIDLYPSGIRIPSNIYQKLNIILYNDAKILKKLNITDYSLVIGIRHLDMSETELIERKQKLGISALFHLTNSLAFDDTEKSNHSDSISSHVNNRITRTSSYSYLKPLEMIHEKICLNSLYDNDSIAYASLPIPGIINDTNKRVFIYLALVDILQTFDSFKYIDQTFRKLTDPDRYLEYSVIEPNEYEKRFHKFLLQNVFVDAKNSFSWTQPDDDQFNDTAYNDIVEYKKIIQQTNNPVRKRSHINAQENSDAVLEYRF